MGGSGQGTPGQVLNAAALRNLLQAATSVTQNVDELGRTPVKQEQSPSRLSKPKRRQVFRACPMCRKVKARCVESRPCPRCVRLNRADICVQDDATVPRKRRKKADAGSRNQAHDDPKSWDHRGHKAMMFKASVKEEPLESHGLMIAAPSGMKSYTSSRRLERFQRHLGAWIAIGIDPNRIMSIFDNLPDALATVLESALEALEDVAFIHNIQISRREAEYMRFRALPSVVSTEALLGSASIDAEDFLWNESPIAAMCRIELNRDGSVCSVFASKYFSTLFDRPHEEIVCKLR